MENLFGATRTVVRRRHALIAPDGHVPSALPGFANAIPFHLITPAMGAAFSQIRIVFEPGGLARFPVDAMETAAYVEKGSVAVRSGSTESNLEPGGFCFAPAGEPLELRAGDAGAEVTCFRKRYEPLPDTAPPAALFGKAADVPGQPFLGDENARLQVLFPEDPPWDMAMNIFTFQPGTPLPFVETHIMEHGLLILRGGGIYRLGEHWYPVRGGDVIWMAPYCPQWFVAAGREPASYLYYKNINRTGA